MLLLTGDRCCFGVDDAQDRSFTFILKTPPASDLLKKAAKVQPQQRPHLTVKPCTASIAYDACCMLARCPAANDSCTDIQQLLARSMRACAGSADQGRQR
jgi:ribosomal protein L11